MLAVASPAGPPSPLGPASSAAEAGAPSSPSLAPRTGAGPLGAAPLSPAPGAPAGHLGAPAGAHLGTALILPAPSGTNTGGQSLVRMPMESKHKIFRL